MKLVVATAILCLALHVATSKQLPQVTRDAILHQEGNPRHISPELEGAVHDAKVVADINVHDGGFKVNPEIERHANPAQVMRVVSDINLHDDEVSAKTAREHHSRPAQVMRVVAAANVHDEEVRANEGKVRHAHHAEVDSKFCNVFENLLSCDFQWQEAARLKQLQEDSIKRVFIQNVSEISIAQSVCLDIVLENVGRALVHGHVNKDCPGSKLLVLRNSTITRLPAAVNSVYASNSIIEDLVLDRVSKTFIIEESRIGTLNLRSSSKTNVELVISRTNIDWIARLQVSNSFLVMLNCTVGSVEDGAMVLDSGRHLIRDVVSKNSSAVPAVHVRGGAELKITDLDGSLNIKSDRTPETLPIEEKRKPKTESSPLCTQTNQGSDYCKVFVILFTFSVFLNVVQLMFNQPRRILNKMFHASPSAKDIARTGRRRKDTANEEEVGVLLHATLGDRKRGVSFSAKDDLLPEVESGDPFGKSTSLSSELNLVDETPLLPYRHSLNIDGVGSLDILRRMNAGSQVPRRRLLSAHT